MSRENTFEAINSQENDIIIYLEEDDWLVKLRAIKHNGVSVFRIRGNRRVADISVKLDIADIMDIVTEAIRLDCIMFEFTRVDFIPFRDATFYLTLPVMHLRFERCDNVKFFISHIFGNNFDKSTAKYNSGHRVNTLWFFNCNDDSLELKKRIKIDLRNNYQFRTIQYGRLSRRSTDTSNKVHDKLNCDINKLLRRNTVCRLIFQRSILTLISLKRFKKNCLINLLPKDVVLIICNMLYKSKEEYCYLLGSKIKLDDPNIEIIYNKNKLPADHQELLTMEYNSWNGKCINPLKELQRKRITLDKLVISDVTSSFVCDSYNSDAIRFSFIPLVFTISRDLKIKILEIRNMDFDEDTIMAESIIGTETLNGDDSKIWELHDLDYVDLQFTEIHLVECKNTWNFIEYFGRLMSKLRKTKIGGTTIIKRFTYRGISLGSLESNTQKNISIFVDREKDFIYIETKN